MSAPVGLPLFDAATGDSIDEAAVAGFRRAGLLRITASVSAPPPAVLAATHFGAIARLTREWRDANVR